MKITITPTDQVSTINGARCRVWIGRTDRGNTCFVYTAGVSCGENDLEARDELLEVLAPIPSGNAEATAAVAELVRSMASDGGLD